MDAEKDLPSSAGGLSGLLGSYSQAMPLPVGGLQLVNLTFLRVEEVRSVRNSSAISKLHGTLGPMGCAWTPPAFGRLAYHMDPVAHLITDASYPRRD